MTTQSRGWFPVEYEMAEADVSYAALGAMVTLRLTAVLHESDGQISKRQAAIVPRELLQELVRTGLLAETETGFQDVTFLLNNTSRHTMAAKREHWRQQKQNQRSARKSALMSTDVQADKSAGVHRSPSPSPSPTPSPTTSQSPSTKTPSRKRLGRSSSRKPPPADLESWIEQGEQTAMLAGWDGAVAVIEHGLGRRLTADERYYLERVEEAYKAQHDYADERHFAEQMWSKFERQARAGEPISSVSYLGALVGLKPMSARPKGSSEAIVTDETPF